MGNINVYLKTFSKEGKLLTETLAYSVGIMSNPSDDDYAQFEDGTTSKTTDLQLPWLKKDCWFEGDNYTDIKAIDVKFDSSGVSNFNRSPIYISIDNLDEALASRDYDNLEENPSFAYLPQQLMTSYSGGGAPYVGKIYGHNAPYKVHFIFGTYDSMNCDLTLNLKYKITYIQISCSTPSSQIYYTTDNSNPTEASTLYTSQFSVSDGTTIKARAYKEGWLESDIATQEVN